MKDKNSVLGPQHFYRVMDGTPRESHGLLAVLTRVALVLALAAGVWSVYRRLPQAEGGAFGDEQAATNLRVVLRRASIRFPVAEGKVPLRVYPINLAAARSEYDSEPHRGQRFEDFVMRQMGNRQPVNAELDERGEAVVTLPPGRWWVHAAIAGEQDLAWRLPVNVSGREVTVELTYDNAYLRAKKF